MDNIFYQGIHHGNGYVCYYVIAVELQDDIVHFLEIQSTKSFVYNQMQIMEKILQIRYFHFLLSDLQNCLQSPYTARDIKATLV